MQQQFETNVCKSETGPPRIEYLRVEKPGSPLVTYYLAINETARGPVAGEEWLQWQPGSKGRPFRFLDFRMGEGFVFPGEVPFETDTRIIKKLQSSEFAEKLESAEMLAVSTLGQFARHPHISVLRRFISDWHLSCLTPGNIRGIPEAGPQECLSQTGDNLPNVIQHFREQYPQHLDNIIARLCRRIPRLERVDTTHSPFFVNGLRPEELWVLYRNEPGFTQARRASDMLGVREFIAAGALLGQLWTEGYFEVGDPVTDNGGPRDTH